MRKTISKSLIIVLVCVIVVQTWQTIKYLPIIERYKQEIQTANELQILYANNEYLSDFDKNASKYNGQVYREGSVITSLAKEGINPGRVVIENASVGTTLVSINGVEKEIYGGNEIVENLLNTDEIKVIRGSIIIHN